MNINIIILVISLTINIRSINISQYENMNSENGIMKSNFGLLGPLCYTLANHFVAMFQVFVVFRSLYSVYCENLHFKVS
ncbi:hypothetical protein C1645_759780 [Glomus cerebriforme]|uniref:Uncharacterized protein n=1 Tax=Glomus cerebriforme TaxID=658196 RepID=A0A397T8Q7_9GLOM|nr:hypothetical protein C1645_759780 [Glomus cerebriforme]